MVEVRTARATERPCALYARHSPKVVRTQGHHIRPVYLQNRVYGRIQDPTLMWLCGNCHDATHEWLSWLLGEARQPSPEPGRYIKTLAQTAFDWYTNAIGDRNGKSKITEQQAELLRAKWATGLYQQKQLGEEFGLHPSHVSRIVNGLRR